MSITVSLVFLCVSKWNGANRYLDLFFKFRISKTFFDSGWCQNIDKGNWKKLDVSYDNFSMNRVGVDFFRN